MTKRKRPPGGQTRQAAKKRCDNLDKKNIDFCAAKQPYATAILPSGENVPLTGGGSWIEDALDLLPADALPEHWRPLALLTKDGKLAVKVLFPGETSSRLRDSRPVLPLVADDLWTPATASIGGPPRGMWIEPDPVSRAGRSMPSCSAARRWPFPARARHGSRAARLKPESAGGDSHR